MIFQVYRTGLSGYQDENFVSREKDKIHQFQQVKYVESVHDLDPNGRIIFITNSQTQIAKLANNLIGHIELIIHPNSGHDNFPLDFVQRASFPIVIGHRIRAHAVVEYTLKALFDALTPLPVVSCWDNKRSYNRSLLIDREVVIVGKGHIGGLLEQSLTPLVKKVHIVDPFKGHQHWPKKPDIVLLSCSLNETSQDLIDSAKLNQFTQNFILINAARGKLIDIKALCEVLKNRPMAQAILDVFPAEPFKDNEFTDLKNLKTTSHIAGVFDGLEDSMLDFEVEILDSFLKMDLDSFKKAYHDELLENKIHQNRFII